MIAYGIDPGTEHSGVVAFDTERCIVLYAKNISNWALLAYLRNPAARSLRRHPDRVYIETIEPMGLPVGKSTLETMRWVGRFQEAWERYSDFTARMISRGDEKTLLCGAATFRDPKSGRRRSVTDAQIRQAIIDRFPATGGGKTPQVGTKKQPGPLYGVKGHAWSALAVVLTGLETTEKGQQS
jgi:hypothetical protein